MNILFSFNFLNLWGREATAYFSSAGNQKQTIGSRTEPLHTKATDVNSGQEVCGFCAKRKYVTRSTGSKVVATFFSSEKRQLRVCTQAEHNKHINHVRKTRGRSSISKSAVWTRGRPLCTKCCLLKKKKKRPERIREEDDCGTQHCRPGQTLKVHKCGSRSRSCIM